VRQCVPARRNRFDSVISIASDRLSVEVSSLGAELQSIVDRNGHNWLWHGDSKFWGGRAPLLFPVIGKSIDGHVSIDGESFPMPSHGIARIGTFASVGQGASSCSFRLADTPDTRASFPFAFALTVTYTVLDSRIATTVEIANPDTRAFPFCFGFHPALMLPQNEGAPVVRLDGNPQYQRIDADGLLLPRKHASPFRDGRLEVKPELFADDALIFTDAGTRVWYGREGRRGVALSFSGLRYLGLWTRPGAPFLCVEPWSGVAAAPGQHALSDRAGAAMLAPGETASIAMEMAFGVAFSSEVGTGSRQENASN
jgi:galactose mutarotase-like enzyme